jgi:hypothetical protein
MREREAKIPPQGQPRLEVAADRLVQLHDGRGKKDRAQEGKAKLQAGKKASGAAAAKQVNGVGVPAIQEGE